MNLTWRNGKRDPEKTAARRVEVYNLRRQGLAFSEIGKRLQITGNRARCIFEVARDIIENEPHPFQSLDCRTRNILSDHEIKTLESLFNFYQKLDASRSRWPRRYGWKSHQGIALILGLPKPEKVSVPASKNSEAFSILKALVDIELENDSATYYWAELIDLVKRAKLVISK
jgi:hypothetical protein